MQSLMVLTTVEQLQALAHPIRQRVLRQLGDAPRTNKQLAERMEIAPGRLHFHVRELEKSGLIELVEERPKGGIVEKYYRAAAENFTLGLSLGMSTSLDETFVGSTFEAALQEYGRALNHFGKTPPLTAMHHSEALLTEPEADRIRDLLKNVGEVITEAGRLETPEPRDLYILTMLMHTAVPSIDDTPEDGDALVGIEG